MRCIEFDFPVGLDSPSMFAYLIRTGYIFSNEINVIGNSTSLISFEEILKSFLLVDQLLIIKNMYAQDEQINSVIDNFFNTAKLHKSYKHPPNNIFIGFKRMESAMHTMVNTWIIDCKNQNSIQGFFQLNKLIEKDIFNLYYANTTESLGLYPVLSVEEILTNKSPEYTIDKSIWLMPNFFYHELFFETLVATDVESIDADMPYFIKFCTVCAVNNLSAPEIKAIKSQLDEKLQPFKQVMDYWATQCYKGSGHEIFINKVLPFANEVQKMMDENELVIHLKEFVKTRSFDFNIYLGEVSPLILWKYYYHYQQITDELYHTMINNYDLQLDYTVPIMLIMPACLPFVLGKEINEEEIAVEQVVTSSKKNINID